MSGDQNALSPIMSNPENVYNLGPNAYGKPATALEYSEGNNHGKRVSSTMRLRPMPSDGNLNIPPLKIFSGPWRTLLQ